MGRRSRKEVETDSEVHALLIHGKNMYQTSLAKKGRTQTLTMKDYLRAIVLDTDPEAIKAMRVTSALHKLQPGEYEDFIQKLRKEP